MFQNGFCCLVELGVDNVMEMTNPWLSNQKYVSLCFQNVVANVLEVSTNIIDVNTIDVLAIDSCCILWFRKLKGISNVVVISESGNNWGNSGGSCCGSNWCDGGAVG